MVSNHSGALFHKMLNVRITINLYTKIQIDVFCFKDSFTIFTTLDRPKITYNWKDITGDFIESSADLKLGELLHDAK